MLQGKMTAQEVTIIVLIWHMGKQKKLKVDLFSV